MLTIYWTGLMKNWLRNKMTKLLLGTISFLLMMGINYLSSAGILFSKTIGDVSRRYTTLITPADYTFSIWGLIYLLLISFLIYNWYDYIKNKNLTSYHKISNWFILSNAANSLWVVVWLNEWIGLSVVLIGILLFSLCQMVRQLNMENWDAPVSIIFFIWWPICIYLGWVLLAAVINVAVYLSSIGWDGGFLSPEIWTTVLIIVSSLLYVLLIYFRNMREAAMVGVWGLIGIVYRQWELTASVAITALLSAVILFVYVGYHGYKNRATSPIAKLLK